MNIKSKGKVLLSVTLNRCRGKVEGLIDIRELDDLMSLFALHQIGTDEVLDIEDPASKDTLYGSQGGFCNGCDTPLALAPVPSSAGPSPV